MENSCEQHINRVSEDLVRDLNLKIIRVTQEIKDHYPELTKFLEEMPVTVPDEKDATITLRSLKSYYDSLNSILNNYISEQA